MAYRPFALFLFISWHRTLSKTKDILFNTNFDPGRQTRNLWKFRLGVETVQHLCAYLCIFMHFATTFVDLLTQKASSFPTSVQNYKAILKFHAKTHIISL